jgi:hypothetical protein
LVDEQQVSKPLSFPAFLVESTEAPIILGFSQLLENMKLIVDSPRNQACVELTEKKG